MQTGGATNGWRRFILRAGVIALAGAIVGLPINDLFKYGLLLAAAVVVFAGAVSCEAKRWTFAIALAAIVVAAHVLFPAPRIDEGFNAFVPPAAGAPSTFLPPDVERGLTAQYNTQYPPETRCEDLARGCWRPDRSVTMDGFAFSADAIYDRSEFSRRVTGIGFSDPVWLRTGMINELIYNWLDNISDVKRFSRDRRSLNFLDRFHVTLPMFVAWRFPADFAGSNLCWHGIVFWEKSGGGFETLKHDDFACRELRAEDTGRTIYAASILRDAQLAVTLRPAWGVALRRAVESGLTLAGVLGIGLLLITVQRRRLLLPATLIALTVAVTFFTDNHFIGGYRPLDSGDDGIQYEGFARDIVLNLLAGNFVAALRGEEAIYYFTPGFRYFRVIERFIFGDTFFGYFSTILVLPLLVLALARRFMPARWALGLVLLFTATPVGVLFGSSLSDYVSAASRGYGDPFAFVLLLAGFVLIVRPPGEMQSRITGAFFGAFLLAMATFCRPNLLLASVMMMACASFLAVRHQQWPRLVALLLGFATLAVSPLHNYVFGNSTILFSDNINQPQTLLMPPLDYLIAARNMVTLDFSSSYIPRAFAQLGRWLGGPHYLLATIPLNLAGFLVLIRIGVFGRTCDPWLRSVALAALLQHGIGICYVNYDRYNLVTWLLTALVSAVWLQAEGLPFMARWWPGFYTWMANAPGTIRFGNWLNRLQQRADFYDLPGSTSRPLPR
jgi:hypothetical protein